ncbi:polyprenol phosphomannose-dependent alpha 1,6 mannosyltransferase MptB [soil metagenome]
MVQSVAIVWRGLLGSMLVLGSSVHGLDLTLGTATAIVGLGLLAWAWLDLLGEAARLGLNAVRAAVAIWITPLLVAPPLFSDDGWSYAAQSWLALHGTNPYLEGPSSLGGVFLVEVPSIWRDTPAPYGPLTLWMGAEAGRLVADPYLLVLVHRGLALLGLALLFWAVPRMASWVGHNPARATALACACPLIVANGVAGLHNDLVMVGLMAAALVLAVDRGWQIGAVVAGLALAMKLPGAAVLLAVVLVSLPAGAGWVSRLRRGLGAGAIAVGVVWLVGLASGLGNGWIGALTVPTTVVTPLSMTAVLGSWTGQDQLTDVVGQVLLVVVAALLALRTATGDPGRALVATAVLTTAMVMLSPVVHIWYLLWAWPFVACLTARRLQPVLRVVAVGFGVCAPLQSDLAGVPHAIAVGVALAVLIGVLLSGHLLDLQRSGSGASRIVQGKHRARRAGPSEQLGVSANRRAVEWR